MRIQHFPPERVPRSKLHKGAYRALPSVHNSYAPRLWATYLAFPLSITPGQHYGPEVQKVVDTVDNDCFACRAAAARSPPR